MTHYRVDDRIFAAVVPEEWCGGPLTINTSDAYGTMPLFGVPVSMRGKRIMYHVMTTAIHTKYGMYLNTQGTLYANAAPDTGRVIPGYFKVELESINDFACVTIDIQLCQIERNQRYVLTLEDMRIPPLCFVADSFPLHLACKLRPDQFNTSPSRCELYFETAYVYPATTQVCCNRDMRAGETLSIAGDKYRVLSDFKKGHVITVAKPLTQVFVMGDSNPIPSYNVQESLESLLQDIEECVQSHMVDAAIAKIDKLQDAIDQSFTTNESLLTSAYNTMANLWRWKEYSITGSIPFDNDMHELPIMTPPKIA